jgi:hypothetical protein
MTAKDTVIRAHYASLNDMNTDQQEPQKATGLWSEMKAVMDLVLDFSFQHFVTPRLIRVLYALSLLGAIFATVTWMFSGFGNGGGIFNGIFTFVTGPVAFLIYILCARVVMEVILAIFQIAEKLRNK